MNNTFIWDIRYNPYALIEMIILLRVLSTCTSSYQLAQHTVIQQQQTRYKSQSRNYDIYQKERKDGRGPPSHLLNKKD